MNSRIKQLISKDYIPSLVITILMAITIIPLVIIAFYSRPCVDDYIYSKDTYELVTSGNWNIFEVIIEAIKTDLHFYKHWQGLYSSAFVLALQPAIFGEKYYCIGAWLLMVLMFLCILYFVRTIFSVLNIKKTYVFAVTMFLLSVILQGLPSPVQGLYWFNGAWNYMPFFFLTLLNISLIIKFLFDSSKQKKYIIFSVLLSFIISGGNHVTGFLNILLLFFEMLIVSKNDRNYVSASLFSAVVGYIIMYLAPGTAIRQSAFSKHGIIETLLNGAMESYDILQEWININWCIYILAITCIALLMSSKIKISKEKFRLSPVILILAFWVILCGMLCVPYMATGGFGAGRLQNVIWMAFMFLSGGIWGYSIIYIIANIKCFEFDNKSSKFLSVLIVTMIMSCFYPESNALKAINELRNGIAHEFSEVCDERYNLICSALKNGIDTVKVNELPDSQLLRFDDITSDGEDWRNQAWEDYYGVRTITIHTDYSSCDDFTSFILDNFDEKETLMILMNKNILKSEKMFDTKDLETQINYKTPIVYMINKKGIKLLDKGLASGFVYNSGIVKYSYFEDDKGCFGIYMDDIETLIGIKSELELYDIVTITSRNDNVEDRTIKYWRLF